MQHFRMNDTKGSSGGLLLHFRQGITIFKEGEPAEGVFKIISGVVRTCKFLRDGRRSIDAFYTCGDVFGFEPGTEYSLSAEAVCNCAIISHQRTQVERLASTDAILSKALFSYALLRLVKAQGHSMLLGRGSAVGKLAGFLVEWSDRSTDCSIIDLAMTRLDIADYLGMTIETVSRTFSRFERDFLIEMSTSRRVRLKNLPQLRRLDAWQPVAPAPLYLRRDDRTALDTVLASTVSTAESFPRMMQLSQSCLPTEGDEYDIAS